MIEFDVETTGLQWYAHDLFLVQFLGHYGPTEPSVYRHPQDRDKIQAALDRGDGYRAWNTKFDLHFLEAAGYRLPPPESWHDGMVLAHIIDERRSVALKARGAMLFGEDERNLEGAVKDWLRQETKDRRAEAKRTGVELIRPNYSDVPDEIMHPYAAGDVLLQRRVCNVYEQRLSEELQGVYELERGVLQALYAAESRGIPADREAALRYEVQLEAHLDELTKRCVDLAGIGSFNPRSGPQLAEALKRRGADLTFAKPTKSGRPSTDEDSLRAVDDDLARAILEFRQADKALGTYLRPMLHPVEDKTFGVRAPFIAPDGRIHPNFRQVGARTRRMSCSDPNMQNWHRDDLRMRHLIHAGEGKRLISADLDAIEMRLFAAFCGPGILLDTMKDPEADIHALTAERVGLHDKDRGGGVFESKRQRGKVFNYSVVYGAGQRSIRREFGVPQGRAKEMLHLYHDAFPEVGEFQRHIEFTLADLGYVKTPWGARHRVEKNAEREAYKFVNYLVQGTAADLIKEATVKCHKAGIPVVAVVHDEILAEVDEVDAEEAAVTIREALIDHPRITEIIPLDADAKIVERWSHAKDPSFVPDYERPE